jgi:hypothetical protein
MNFYGQVVKDFHNYPALVAKVAQLLAEGDYVCVLLGDGVAVATTWDDSDISAVAKKAHLDPKEDGSLGFLGWTAGTTVDNPVVVATLAVIAQGANVEPHSATTDNELHDWLIWASEHSTCFLHAIAEAAFLSDLKHYRLLRPVLLNLKRMYPGRTPQLEVASLRVKDLSDFQLTPGLAEALTASLDDSYREYFAAACSGRSTKEAKRRIAAIPEDRRYLTRVLDSLDSAFADLDTATAKLDLPHMQNHKPEAIKGYLEFRLQQFRMLLNAVEGYVEEKYPATGGHS